MFLKIDPQCLNDKIPMIFLRRRAMFRDYLYVSCDYGITYFDYIAKEIVKFLLKLLQLKNYSRNVFSRKQQADSCFFFALTIPLNY